MSNAIFCYLSELLAKFFGQRKILLIQVLTKQNHPCPKIFHLKNQHSSLLIYLCIVLLETETSCNIFQFLNMNLLCLKDKPREVLPSLSEMRDLCMQHLDQMRPDHMRRLNPTPYKVVFLFHQQLLSYNWRHHVFITFVLYHSCQVSVSAKLYDFIHFLWLSEAPVGELL